MKRTFNILPNLHNNLGGRNYDPPFYRREHGDSEKFTKLSKIITQLALTTHTEHCAKRPGGVWEGKGQRGGIRIQK